MAAFVYSTAPRRRQNRALALFLVLQSIVHGVGQGLMYVVDDREAVLALQIMSVSFAVAASASYLLFLSTLPTPLTRPLRHPGVVGALVAASVAWFAAVVLQPHWFVKGVVNTFAYTKWEGDTTSAFTLAYVLGDGLAGLLGLVASVLMIRASRRGTLPRRKAAFYVAAFVVFDVFVALDLSLFNFLSSRGVLLDQLVVHVWIQNLGFTLFVLLVGYGILKAQLFDIDLKVKFVLRRGTIGAIFLGVFLVVENIVQNVTNSSFGLLAGSLAAALLLLALHPLQRMAERLANTAMPSVEATPGYVAGRKLDVYRDAVESLIADGELTRKERMLLDRLRAKLGIDLTAAYQVEQQAWAQVPRPRAAPGA